MFRIPSFLVEDKNLPKVLTALAGLALNLEAPQPVTNAVVKNGKVVAETEGGSIREQLESKISSLPKDTVLTSANFKQLIVSLGGAETSYNHFIAYLKEAKLIKMRSRGTYVRTGG